MDLSYSPIVPPIKNTILELAMKPDISFGNQMKCTTCHKPLEPDNTYAYLSKALCEDCCMDARTPGVRKTHWQYIGSIKADYLIPEKKDR